MGNSKSQFRKLSRRNSHSISHSHSVIADDTTAQTGTGSRSHSLASNTTGGSDVSRLSMPDMESGVPLKIPPGQMSPEQLALVKFTWQMVSIDTSSVCLNFFHLLQRRFPRIKRINQQRSKLSMAMSTPSLPLTTQLMTRNKSCTSTFTTHGQLTQHALKLACCLDAIIGSLVRNPGSKTVREEKVADMLAENGSNFKAFLGFENFYSDAPVVREMTHAFVESLRLVLVHNGAKWGQELQESWDNLFCILLYHLDGLEEEDTNSW